MSKGSKLPLKFFFGENGKITCVFGFSFSRIVSRDLGSGSPRSQIIASIRAEGGGGKNMWLPAAAAEKCPFDWLMMMEIARSRDIREGKKIISQPAQDVFFSPSNCCHLSTRFQIKEFCKKNEYNKISKDLHNQIDQRIVDLCFIFSNSLKLHWLANCSFLIFCILAKHLLNVLRILCAQNLTPHPLFEVRRRFRPWYNY